jgi:hypothetical protein
MASEGSSHKAQWQTIGGDYRAGSDHFIVIREPDCHSIRYNHAFRA